MAESKEMVRYAELIADELRELERTLIDEGSDAFEIVVNYVNETILEAITWQAQNRSDLVRVEWLRTYGGPGCRIFFEGDEYATVKAYDMEGDSTIWVHVPNLANQVLELATC